jgi:hypothetical protein
VFLKRIHSLCLGLLLLTAAGVSVHAQENRKVGEDRVLLLSAKTAQLIQKDGVDYRKVVGPARFLHNDTYLICDTALWNVNTNVIDAVGHVRIIQDRTTLSSTYLQYVSDENMARFRGDLVQLQDKDGNTLRTRYLDYNTKDSVAVFQNGGAMKDKDGQVMESRYGLYDAKGHLFVFNDQVNMYLDTTFVKTSRLEYRSDLSTAYFGYGTDMWQDDNMLSANDGWYDRSRELFFFRRNVHMLTQTQEAWADSLYYYRALNDVDMMGEVELMDTTRNVFALAGRFEYRDSLSQIIMTLDPAVMSVSEENGKLDTLYLGGDYMRMRAYKMCDIPQPWIAGAEKRLKDIGGDPVMEYRRKAAEEAAKKAEAATKRNAKRAASAAAAAAAEAGEQDQGAPPAGPPPAGAPPEQQEAPPAPPADTLSMPRDSLVTALPDSLGTAALPDSLGTAPLPDVPESAAPADTVVAAPPLDTTKVNFFWASRNVRLYRNNMQMACDSLTYTDLDSLARMYGDPIIYNEGNKQYTSDSIYVAIRNREADKAHLQGNAFITIQEAPDAFDQIRSVEMIAYFDSTRTLRRFDALGGASSLFYLAEEDALATVNKVEAKMIYATFKQGEIDHVYYFDNPTNDGYPTVQLPKSDKTLKGFRWDPEKRPASARDVTSLVPRKSERVQYLGRPHVGFEETEKYFPGYVSALFRQIAVRDSLTVAREERRRAAADSLERTDRESRMLADSLMNLAVADSLGLAEMGALGDSLAIAPAEPLSPPADTLGSAAPLPPVDTLQPAEEPVVPVPLTPEEIKAQEKAAREAEKARQKAEQERIKAEKQAAREAKWAEEDRKYEEKQAAKAQKKLERERAKKLKVLRRLEKKAAKERKRLEKYLERERRRQEKKQNKKSES